MPQPPANKSNYNQLLAALRREIKAGTARLEHYVDRQKVTTYWKVGKHITDSLLDDEFQTAFGSDLFGRLAGDLEVNERHLHYCVRFYRFYPVLPRAKGLTWTDYTLLLNFEDPKERKKWQERIVQKKISSGALKKILYDLRRRGRALAPPSGTRQPVRRGRLYLYHMVKPGSVHRGSPRPVVDCGFEFHVEQPPLSSTRFNSGDLVLSEKTATGYRIKHIKEDRAKLYTYKAVVERVIDGDTLLVDIDCGFSVGLRQRLRLKDIDSPELHTITGRRAQKYLKDYFRKVPLVVIKTYGSDKYDRYLVDVFALKGVDDIRTVAARGEFLNQKLLDEGLATRWLP